MPRERWIMRNDDGSFLCLLCGRWGQRYPMSRTSCERNRSGSSGQGGVGIFPRPTPLREDHIYQEPNLRYEELDGGGRGQAVSVWRVQFEDADEFELTAPEIEAAIQNFQAQLPMREIEIPLDRGQRGRTMPGANPEEEEEEQEQVDLYDEVSVNDGDGGGTANEEEDLEEEDLEREDESDSEISAYASDEDEELEVLSDHHVSLESRLTDRSGVNVFSHIYRTLEDRKSNTTNSTIIENFAREMEDYDVKLPKTWNQLKRILQVPSLEGCVRHMCTTGHHVWRYLAEDDYENHKDEKCPRSGCGRPRFRITGEGKLVPCRVLWYLGLHDTFKSYFNDKEWSKHWKQGLDISANSVWASPHVADMNRFFNGQVLKTNGGLYNAYDDGFQVCQNGTNGVTLFGIQSLDLPNSAYSKSFNRRAFMFVRAPEPANTSLLLEEVIEDMNDLAQNGVLVRMPKDNRQFFRYYPFLESWDCDGKARKSLLQFGGAGKYISSPSSSQVGTYRVGTTWYTGGYARPVLQATFPTMRLYANAAQFQRFHNEMVEILEAVRHVEIAVEQGERGAKTRLDEIKQFTGCSSGECKLLGLLNCDLRNMVKAATCHQNLLGLMKADFYAVMLQYYGVQWFRRIDERAKLITRPSEVTRPVKRLLPENVSANTPALSGWICQHVWNHIDSTGLLSVFTFAFEEHESLLLLEAGVQLDFIAVLATCKHILWRLISGIHHSLRNWAEISCTHEEAMNNPGYLEMVNLQIELERMSYKEDMWAAAAMMEGCFPVTALSTNLHHAVVGKAKSGSRTSTMIIETMVNDYLLQRRMLQLSHHHLYQRRERDHPNNVEYGGRELLRMDGYGPGARDTGIRVLGKPYGRLHGVALEDVRQSLVQLLRGTGPGGESWPEQPLQGWNEEAVMRCTLELHSFASMPQGKQFKLAAAVKMRNGVDNSWFSIHLPRSDESKSGLPFPPTEIPEEERRSQCDIPRDLTTLWFDYENLSMFTQAKVFFVATATGLPPLRGAYGDIYPAERMCAPRKKNIWRSHKDIMSRGACLLDVELRKLVALAARLDMSPEESARTGLRPGDVFVATVPCEMFAKNDY